MHAAALDQVLNDHYMYEATDDVDGVVSTVTDDVKQYFTGSPLGELTGKDAARAFYGELFMISGVRASSRLHAGTATTSSSTKSSGLVRSTKLASSALKAGRGMQASASYT